MPVCTRWQRGSALALSAALSPPASGQSLWPDGRSRGRAPPAVRKRRPAAFLLRCFPRPEFWEAILCILLGLCAIRAAHHACRVPLLPPFPLVLTLSLGPSTFGHGGVAWWGECSVFWVPNLPASPRPPGPVFSSILVFFFVSLFTFESVASPQTCGGSGL